MIMKGLSSSLTIYNYMLQLRPNLYVLIGGTQVNACQTQTSSSIEFWLLLTTSISFLIPMMILWSIFILQWLSDPIFDLKLTERPIGPSDRCTQASSEFSAPISMNGRRPTLYRITVNLKLISDMVLWLWSTERTIHMLYHLFLAWFSN